MHIVEHHDELAGYREAVLDTIENPDAIARGKASELLALKTIGGRTLVVVYREVLPSDGFVITAFFTTQRERIQRRGFVWPRP
jgi:hypothetical protein